MAVAADDPTRSNTDELRTPTDSNEERSPSRWLLVGGTVGAALLLVLVVWVFATAAGSPTPTSGISRSEEAIESPGTESSTTLPQADNTTANSSAAAPATTATRSAQPTGLLQELYSDDVFLACIGDNTPIRFSLSGSTYVWWKDCIFEWSGGEAIYKGGDPAGHLYSRDAVLEVRDIAATATRSESVEFVLNGRSTGYVLDRTGPIRYATPDGLAFFSLSAPLDYWYVDLSNGGEFQPGDLCDARLMRIADGIYCRAGDELSRLDLSATDHQRWAADVPETYGLMDFGGQFLPAEQLVFVPGEQGSDLLVVDASSGMTRRVARSDILGPIKVDRVLAYEEGERFIVVNNGFLAEIDGVGNEAWSVQLDNSSYGKTCRATDIEPGFLFVGCTGRYLTRAYVVGFPES